MIKSKADYKYYLEKDRIANYMHKDFVERNASVYLQCAENIKGQINI